MRLMILSIAIMGCDGNTVVIDKVENVDVLQDLDGDGFLEDEDCDDNDAQINSGIAETCDGIDNNCDGQIDEGVLATFYLDEDGDGFGDPESNDEYCDAPEGYVPSGTDCDDSNAEVYVGNNEYCDGIDNNCDGQIDEGVGFNYYADTDEDGYGDSEQSQVLCEVTDGYVLDSTDCDDSNSIIHPTAPDICDGLDNDCDEAIDEDNLLIQYFDEDDDGYGSEASVVEHCERLEHYVLQGGDCDDINPQIKPLATEVCDGLDNDCDGNEDDDAIDRSTWYIDSDADGFGELSQSLIDCDQPTGYVSDSTDCDDTEGLIYPQAAEVCDGLDNDCDSMIDDLDPDVQNQPTWYLDADSDTYGTDSITTLSCNQPPSYIGVGGDCDDLNSQMFPTGIEVCDGLDNDCNGQTDEGVELRFYLDDDNDGYGDANSMLTDCVQPAGYVSNSDDCDDTESLAWTGNTETCDSVDNDCNGQVDEGVELSFYLDIDGDGYGDANSMLTDCVQPAGYVSNSDDCDDTESLAWTGNTETCDSVDNDCNGQVDEGVELSFYLDIDGDGYGTTNTFIEACSSPSSAYVALDGDCDDSEITYHPNAPIGCADIDQNCDGIIDQDNDGDGFSDYDCGGSDCDDSDISMFPNVAGDCPFGTDCLDILQQGYANSGQYNIDPDGHNVGVDAEDVWCEQQEYGGGWTLAGLNDPSNSLWNSTNIRDVNGFGDFSGGDYKSGLVFTELGFTDMMFTDGILYAVYENMGNGSESYLEFSDSIPHWNCAPESGYEWGMTAGNLSGGSLCDTNIYMHPIDRDGYGNCNPYAQWSGNASGPTWSVTNNGSCPLDDPSSASFISVTSSTFLPWSTTVPFYMYIR